MRSIPKILALAALAISPAHADTTVTVKTSLPWVGYMNVFNLPADGGGFVFGSNWGTADLCATFSGSQLTLSPNKINPPSGQADSFWYKPNGTGNKTMDANLYVQVDGGPTTVGALSGQNVTFTGTVNAKTLTAPYTSVAFIKDFAPDYSSSNTITAPLVSGGSFSITLATNPGVGRHVQYGFETIGPNVWAADAGPFGNVTISATGAVPGNPNVKVDPAAAWQGYMNITDPNNNNEYVTGGTWPTKDLAAVFSGPSLTLRPNSIDDASYYDSGVGNKTMEANMYVETRPGLLSGQTVNFSGTVASNSLSATHTTIAFIKDYTADYSSSVSQTVTLAPGPFSLSLPTIADPTRHIQYGFQVVGAPVPIESISSFGSVQINTDLTNSYATWLSGFDFSAFTNPNLAQSGDPDGDRQNNFAEFALNSDPTNAASSGKINSQVGTVGASNAMLMTLPIFNGASFSGTTAKSATIGQIAYTIEGSNSLSVFDQAVSEVIPAVDGGLPPVSSGWNYRTFRLNGAVGGASSRGPTGFLRARTAPAP